MDKGFSPEDLKDIEELKAQIRPLIDDVKGDDTDIQFISEISCRAEDSVLFAHIGMIKALSIIGTIFIAKHKQSCIAFMVMKTNTNELVDRTILVDGKLYINLQGIEECIGCLNLDNIK